MKKLGWFSKHGVPSRSYTVLQRSFMVLSIYVATSSCDGNPCSFRPTSPSCIAVLL